MTNKTKLSAAALFSALVLGGTFATSTVFADDTAPAPTGQAGPDPVKGGEVSEVGHAYVTFTKDKPNTIHDPSNPGSTTDPSNPDETNETGELTLDAIPSSLNFGTQESDGAGQVVKLLASDDSSRAISKGAAGDGITTSDHTGSWESATDKVLFTQVTNIATSNPTWELSATMSGFTNGTNKDALPGAFITFGGGMNVIDQYDKTTNKESWAKAKDDLTTGAVLTANDKDGVSFVTSDQTGIFQQQWNVNDVTLTTPTAPAKGEYTSNINWTLTATPAAQTGSQQTPGENAGGATEG